MQGKEQSRDLPMLLVGVMHKTEPGRDKNRNINSKSESVHTNVTLVEQIFIILDA